MNGVTYAHFAGLPVVIKKYGWEETKRFKCIGSGARNESMIPAPLAELTPTLFAYTTSEMGEEVVLEYRTGQLLQPDEMGIAEATIAGTLLGRIHSIVGLAFGSLDRSYQYNSLSEAFAPRWHIAMQLLAGVDHSLAKAADKWARQYICHLDAVQIPCLVHGDFGLANLLWYPSREIAAILDWEHARFGDPREDWAKIILASRFPEQNGFGQDMKVLSALRHSWQKSMGSIQTLEGPAMDLYEAYYAATLGVFFGDAGRKRLEWLAYKIK